MVVPTTHRTAAMRPLRRAPILSAAAAALLAACGGGSSSEAGSRPGGGLGSSDSIAITSFSPTSAPATSTQPIMFTVNYDFDLETQTSGVVQVGYRLSSTSIVYTGVTQAISGKGAGSGTLSFSLPASALASSDLGVAVALSGGGSTLAQATATVARTQ
jgi:hypothetical protein